MSNNDFTIKVSLDFNEKDIDKLRDDVKKAVNSGSRSSSVGRTGVISKKVSEIEAEASSSIYKYGTNHIKTKSILGDLSKAKRVEHSENIFSEREKRESIKTESLQSILNSRHIREKEFKDKRAKHNENIFSEREKRESIKTESQQSILNARRIREKELKDKVDGKETKKKNAKIDEMFRNIRSISFSSGKSASGIVSLAARMGPIGMVLGTIAAVGYGIKSLVSWAGNKNIGYASAALGASGYSTGEMAALKSGDVLGVNKDIGNSIADAITLNAQTLSPNYLPRRAEVAARALRGVAMFTGGDTSGIRNLLNIKKNMSEKDIYSMVFSDIRGYMKSGNVNAAVGLGEGFTLSKEAVMASQYTDINKGIEKTGNTGMWRDFNNLTQSALSQTSYADGLTAFLNKFAAAITEVTNKIGNAGRKLEASHYNLYPLENYMIPAPGNSPKGLK
jgi:hypothetical protein